MELDDMKLAWQTMGAQLERQQALNWQLFHDNRLDRLRRGLRPLVWGQLLQMLAGVMFVVWAVAFWSTHWQTTHLLVCGLLVQLCGVLFIAMAGRVLYLIQRIDYAAPVLDIQRRLADLRAWRVRVEAPFNVVLGSFIWIPVLWMNLAWYGVDLWSPGFLVWAIGSGLVGVAACALVVWGLRRIGWSRRLENHAAGTSVQKAEAALDEIVRFEREA